MDTGLSPNFCLKKCPPGAAQGAYEVQQVLRHAHRPVSAEMDGDGEVQSTGIDWSDYTRMQTVEHKATTGARRLPTPSWALNSRELQELLVRFFENRARTNGTGSLVQRLNAAQQVLLTQLPWMTENVDRFCREYREARTTDPARAWCNYITAADGTHVR